MFLHIFLLHHNCIDLIFAIKANVREFFVSRMDAVASKKEVPTRPLDVALLWTLERGLGLR
jgi:hypothetical protein